MAQPALVNPTGRPRTLSALHASPGHAACYRRRLDACTEAMHRSIVYWLRARYRANPPAAARDDVLPASTLEREMRTLGSRWEDRFDELAPKLAGWFAKGAVRHADTTMAAALRRAGMTVRFQASPEVRDIFKATLNEQVSLIKSIPRQHLREVAGIVNRNVQKGGDLGAMVQELTKAYGVTRRRAAFIARSQTNIAMATISKARQLELGITCCIWLHSGGGNHPRPSHVAFSGKKYDVAKGAYLDGEYVWPGTAPNCRCSMRPIIPGLD